MDMSIVAASVNAQLQIQALGEIASGSAPQSSFAQVLGAASAGQQAGSVPVEVLLSGAVRMLNSGDGAQTMDPLLAQLMQTLKDVLGGKQTDGQADIAALIARVQARLREIMQQNGEQMAADQAVALMTQLMPDLMQNPAISAQVQQSGGPILQMLLSVQPETLAQMVTVPAETDASAAQPFAQALAGTQDAQAKTPEWAADVVQTNVSAAPGGEAAQTAMRGGLDFAAAVRMAKQQLNTGEQTVQPAQDVDIDTLQKQVDAGTFMRGTAFATAALGEDAQVQPTPIAPPEVQLWEGITAGLAGGQDQFSIKLVPEGLGEVTVNIVRTTAGMTLDIIAKNPETQKLLAAQMEPLRDALRPMKVEVGSVLTQSQFELLSDRRQEAGEERQQRYNMHGAAYYGDEPLSGVQETAPPVMAAVPGAALNAYI